MKEKKMCKTMPHIMLMRYCILYSFLLPLLHSSPEIFWKPLPLCLSSCFCLEYFCFCCRYCCATLYYRQVFSSRFSKCNASKHTIHNSHRNILLFLFPSSFFAYLLFNFLITVIAGYVAVRTFFYKMILIIYNLLTS